VNADADDRGADPDVAPAFARDTWMDKGVRFGCGAVLATVIVVSVALFVPVGTVSGVVVVWILASAMCGIVAAVAGGRFLESLLRFMRWL
jgi:hypothetical protein